MGSIPITRSACPSEHTANGTATGFLIKIYNVDHNGDVMELVDSADSNPAERKLVRVRISSSPQSVKKWDDIQLTDAVRTSFSIRQILRKLGLKPAGCNYLTIKKRVRELNLATDHWTGRASNKGIHHKSGIKKLISAQILVLDRRNGVKECVSVLRRALIESGITEQCSLCGLDSKWNGKPLRLQIDHVNGNPLDNRPGNTRFLCPNCHSQTANFGVKNITFIKKPKAKRKRVYGVRKPSKIPRKEILEALVSQKPITQIALEYGVSDTRIRKKCKEFGIETKGPGFWAKQQSQISRAAL